MEQVKQWFDEAIENHIKVFTAPESEFIIYKGFKITKTIDGNYIIQDVRINNFYSKVSDKDLSVLTTLGFIKGVEKLSYDRNLRRVVIYTKKLEKLYSEREICQKRMSTNVTFYSKKLRNCKEGIGKYIDLLF